MSRAGTSNALSLRELRNGANRSTVVRAGRVRPASAETQRRCAPRLPRPSGTAGSLARADRLPRDYDPLPGGDALCEPDIRSEPARIPRVRCGHPVAVPASHDSALRANGLLLGDLLGQVLVEQEGVGVSRHRRAGSHPLAPGARHGRTAVSSRRRSAESISRRGPRCSPRRPLLPAREHRRATPGVPAGGVTTSARVASRAETIEDAIAKLGRTGVAGRGARPGRSRRARGAGAHGASHRSDASHRSRRPPAHRQCGCACWTTSG